MHFEKSVTLNFFSFIHQKIGSDSRASYENQVCKISKLCVKYFLKYHRKTIKKDSKFREIFPRENDTNSDLPRIPQPCMESPQFQCVLHAWSACVHPKNWNIIVVILCPKSWKQRAETFETKYLTN